MKRHQSRKKKKRNGNLGWCPLNKDLSNTLKSIAIVKNNKMKQANRALNCLSNYVDAGVDLSKAPTKHSIQTESRKRLSLLMENS